MALQFTLQTDFGVEANYWRLKTVHIDRMDDGALEVNMVVELYLDEGKRRSGASPVQRSTFSMTVLVDSALSIADLYRLLKLYLPGAEDC